MKGWDRGFFLAKCHVMHEDFLVKMNIDDGEVSSKMVVAK